MSEKRVSRSARESSLARIADSRTGLPPGWAWTDIETIGEVTLGRQRSPKDHDGPHMRPYLRVANVYEDLIDTTDVKSMNFTPEEFAKFQLRRGDVLLNEGQSKELVGRSAIFKDEVPNACFQNTLVRFRPVTFVLPEYALTIFRCYLHTGEFQRIARWTTNIAHLGAQRFATMDFPLAPVAEQRRIVDAIESYLTRLDATVATLERVERNLKRYRASVLKSAVEGRIVPTEAALARHEGRAYEPASVLLERILVERRRRWSESGKKGEYQEPTPPETSDLPILPEGWCWASAEQVSDLITKGTTPAAETLSSGSGDVPFIKVYNLTFTGILNFSLDPTFIPDCVHRGELARSVVRPGDVLMNIVGPPLGKVSIVPGNFSEWNINQAVARYRPIGGLSSEYLAVVLRSETTLAWAKRRAKATAGQFNLTLEVCRSLPVPLPPTIEQARIVAVASMVESVCDINTRALVTNLARCSRLRQSILKWAFEGKLADQDPTDEPASVLLERIKAERTQPAKMAPQQRKAAKKGSRA